MNLKLSLYVCLAVLGTCGPWLFNVQFITAHDGVFDVITFVRDAYANPAAASLTTDLSVACTTFLLWMMFEARRLDMRHVWGYVVLTFGVAFACAFPVFLIMRERRLHQLRVQQS